MGHTAGGFLSALRPLCGSGGSGLVGAGLALVPFVREGDEPAGPVAIETPATGCGQVGTASST